MQSRMKKCNTQSVNPFHGQVNPNTLGFDWSEQKKKKFTIANKKYYCLNSGLHTFGYTGLEGRAVESF